ncbi:Pirin [Cladobotryum mycophilum]|uniref:Pirin n=1 Tax=Cladobotryum mycophilum TaxID=491253 RepID=A0ABR0SZJ0_9HYPO
MLNHLSIFIKPPLKISHHFQPAIASVYKSPLIVPFPLLMKLFHLIIAILIGLSSTILYKHRGALTDLTSVAINSIANYYNIYLKSSSEADKAETRTLSPQPVESNILQGTIPEPDHHLFATEMSVARTIRKAFLAIEQAEGQGARVRRSIGTPNLRNFSPFLMLDHFSIKPGAGFPDHPHRGQETITYLIQGGVDHEDFAGNRGTLNSGDLQFMTAGRGIVHAEMPRQNPDGSANVGLQLWVDLPQQLKNCEPRYRDLRASEIPAVDVDDGKATIKVISGQSHGVDSVKDLAYTPVWILDVILRPGAKVTQPLPQGWNAFAYILEGNAWFSNGDDRQKVEQYHNVVFEPQGDVVHLELDADAEQNSRIVLIAGTPLDQPIVQYGPFVVTSKEEVYQALFDYQSHANGFERAKDWESEIGKSMLT